MGTLVVHFAKDEAAAIEDGIIAANQQHPK
jgi:hypothetical protein